MKRLDLLTEKDLLDNNHFPVQALFNEIFIDQFLDTVINFIANGHGFGAEYGACVFPNDLDEYDIATGGMFEGVEFGLHNGEEVLLDYKTFYYYLKLVCERYLLNFPEKENDIIEALDKYRVRYNIN